MYSVGDINKEAALHNISLACTANYRLRGFPVAEVKYSHRDRFLVDDTDHLIFYLGKVALGKHDGIHRVEHYKSVALRKDRQRAGELLRFIFSGMKVLPKNKYFMKIDCGLIDISLLYQHRVMRIDYDILFPHLKLIRELCRVTDYKLILNNDFEVYNAARIQKYLKTDTPKVLFSLDQVEIDEDGDRYISLVEDIDVVVAYQKRLERIKFDCRTGYKKEREVLYKGRNPS